MTNTIEISGMTDRALDAFLAAKGDPNEPVDVDHLTPAERRQVAVAMGWDITRSMIIDWIGR
ncbi:MAG: hypothetical protein GWN87_12350 [Desulfuromonadales bacterium]|nr:hypothetical protein [Desulfuromonadales bacterium]